MSPCRPGYGGFSCLQEGIDINIRKHHQAGISGTHFKGHRHEDRHIRQRRKRHGSQLHSRLDHRCLPLRVKGNHRSRQGAVQRSEDLLLQRFPLFRREICFVRQYFPPTISAAESPAAFSIPRTRYPLQPSAPGSGPAGAPRPPPASFPPPVEILSL